MYRNTIISNLLTILQFSTILHTNLACIELINRQWKRMSLEERTKRADVVLSARILSTAPIPGQKIFYAATFEVMNVLKGWELLKLLHKSKSLSIVSLGTKIVVSAKGFADSRHCFSNVEVDESYVLFLGYKRETPELVARYDDYFGAAELLYKRTERNILQSLGWEEWSNWSKCNKFCGTGTQQRSRECSIKEPCHGPREQARECNTFYCSDTINILPFILEYQHDENMLPWKLPGEKFTNDIEQRSVTKAPTHLLFTDSFPKDSVLHVSFKGPVKEPQYVYSVYNANDHLIFGVKLSPYDVNFIQGKRADSTVNLPREHSFPHPFTSDMWYTFAIHLSGDEIKIKIDCGEVYASTLVENIFDNMDIFGQMYLGGGPGVESKEQVKVEIGQISLVKDPTSLGHQCGKIILDTDERKEEINKDGKVTEISGDGPLAGPDDSESGDVEEGYGSGETKVSCDCENGGVCKQNGVCKCPQGWSGDKCETPMCYNKCLNGGNCTKPNTCSCRKGTSGKYCQFTECQLPCKNGGMCIGPNKCKCKQGFQGTQCQTKICQKKCENGGTCFDNKCQCPKGFKGDTCQEREKCMEYTTKRVSFTKPAVSVKIVCKERKDDLCQKTVLEQVTRLEVHYRQEYVCKT